MSHLSLITDAGRPSAGECKEVHYFWQNILDRSAGSAAEKARSFILKEIGASLRNAGLSAGHMLPDSMYGLQLREKQKARRIYGILENQFRRYFVKAERQPGVTGENLLRLLERRLDNVVYRLGLGSSRSEARQLVLHAHFLVNGHKVNIPSYLVRVGDVISVRINSKESPKF